MERYGSLPDPFQDGFHFSLDPLLTNRLNVQSLLRSCQPHNLHSITVDEKLIMLITPSRGLIV